MATTDKHYRLAKADVLRKYPDIEGEDLEEEIREVLADWAADEAHDREVFGEPMDTDCIENGRDNCDDAGTGEGRWHGRF